MARYLVTGGTGFLGKHLCKLLLAEGHHVDVLARKTDAELASLDANFVVGNVLDSATIAGASKQCQGIFHLAGKVSRQQKDAHELFELHVQGTKNVLDAAAKAGIKRVVVASTSGVIGISNSANAIANEKSPYALEIAQHFPYYLAKIYAEKAAIHAANVHGIELVLMRPSLLLGPDDTRFSSTGDILNFLHGDIKVIPPGGISFVDVRDAAQAFVAAMEKSRPAQSYLLGAANMSFEVFFQRVASLARRQRFTFSVPPNLRAFSQRLVQLTPQAMLEAFVPDKESAELGHYFWYIDWTLAASDLGFSPRPADETIQDTIEWLRQTVPQAPGPGSTKSSSFVRGLRYLWANES